MSAKKATSETASQPQHDALDTAIEHIRAALRGLQFGMVTIIVQDGVVIQIERTEKTRLRSRQPHNHS
jgi:hypothetical protein